MSEALVQELLDREEIKELKARYFRGVDDRDWETFRSVLADDAELRLMDLDPIVGADAFVAFARQGMEGARSVHHAHMPELAFDGPTEARATWAMTDYVEYSPSDDGARRGFRSFGHYRERYRKIDGAWKIASSHLTYLRVDPLPAEPLPETILGGPDLLRA